MKYQVKDISLADKGKLRIEWAEAQMPVLRKIKEEFSVNKPFRGVRIGACLHVTTETANLMITLKEGGAQLALTASNPLSTQDDVAASLAKHHGISVFAIKGEDEKTYYHHIDEVLSIEPNITMDDGADLVSTLHRKGGKLLSNVIGGTEETTTGVIRLRAMAENKVLAYPLIAVNDAYTKYLFDNRYGTGQSTLDGILRATNFLIAGSYFVVAGYGWCGRGIAMRARGAGAKVIVTETDPLRALEANMDGYMVMKMEDAAKLGQIFVTAAGDKHVIRKEHFLVMKDGAVVANSGHFNVEIDIPALEGLSVSKRKIRDFVDEYKLKDGKRIYLLAEGRLVNLSAAEGHPAAVMDMSFANQALSALYIKENGSNLERKVYRVPAEIDERIAVMKLQSLGIDIDELTQEQKEYLNSWQEGT